MEQPLTEESLKTLDSCAPIAPDEPKPATRHFRIARVGLSGARQSASPKLSSRKSDSAGRQAFGERSEHEIRLLEGVPEQEFFSEMITDAEVLSRDSRMRSDDSRIASFSSGNVSHNRLSSESDSHDQWHRDHGILYPVAPPRVEKVSYRRMKKARARAGDMSKIASAAAMILDTPVRRHSLGSDREGKEALDGPIDELKEVAMNDPMIRELDKKVVVTGATSILRSLKARGSLSTSEDFESTAQASMTCEICRTSLSAACRFCTECSSSVENNTPPRKTSNAALMKDTMTDELSESALSSRRMSQNLRIAIPDKSRQHTKSVRESAMSSSAGSSREPTLTEVPISAMAMDTRLSANSMSPKYSSRNPTFSELPISAMAMDTRLTSNSILSKDSSASLDMRSWDSRRGSSDGRPSLDLESNRSRLGDFSDAPSRPDSIAMCLTEAGDKTPTSDSLASIGTLQRQEWGKAGYVEAEGKSQSFQEISKIPTSHNDMQAPGERQATAKFRQADVDWRRIPSTKLHPATHAAERIDTRDNLPTMESLPELEEAGSYGLPLSVGNWNKQTPRDNSTMREESCQSPRSPKAPKKDRLSWGHSSRKEKPMERPSYGHSATHETSMERPSLDQSAQKERLSKGVKSREGTFASTAAPSYRASTGDFTDIVRSTQGDFHSESGFFHSESTGVFSEIDSLNPRQYVISNEEFLSDYSALEPLPQIDGMPQRRRNDVNSEKDVDMQDGKKIRDWHRKLHGNWHARSQSASSTGLMEGRQ